MWPCTFIFIPKYFPFFFTVFMWSSGSFPWMNIGIWPWLVNFFPPSIYMKKVESIFHVCNLDWWVSHHLTTCPVKVSSRLCSRPCSPMFLDTCSICITGDSLYLYFGICLILTIFAFNVGYSLLFFSNIFGMMETRKHCSIGFFFTVWMVHRPISCVL